LYPLVAPLASLLLSFRHAAPPVLSTLSLHDALPISLLGPQGLARVAGACHANTAALVKRLTAIPGVEQVFGKPFFHEAVLRFPTDRKSTRLNSSHVSISYAVFCLKKKKYDHGEKGSK